MKKTIAVTAQKLQTMKTVFGFHTVLVVSQAWEWHNFFGKVAALPASSDSSRLGSCLCFKLCLLVQVLQQALFSSLIFSGTAFKMESMDCQMSSRGSTSWNLPLDQRARMILSPPKPQNKAFGVLTVCPILSPVVLSSKAHAPRLDWS